MTETDVEDYDEDVQITKTRIQTNLQNLKNQLNITKASSELVTSIKEDLEQCDNSIKHMERYLKQISSKSEAEKMKTKIADYKSEIKTMKQEYESQKQRVSTALSASDDLQESKLKSYQVHDETAIPMTREGINAKLLKDSKETLNQTETVANSTLLELHHQRQKIENIDNNLRKTNNVLIKIKRRVLRMTYRQRCISIVMCLLILVIMGAIAGLIVLRRKHML